VRTNTTSRLRILLGIGAAVVTTATLALPGAAFAADDPATLVALTEQDPATGKNKAYPVKQGETVPAVLGVANAGTTPVKGVVAHVHALNDMDLPTKFDNCRYYVDSNRDGAWCQFDDELAVGGTYAMADHLVALAPKARADKLGAIVFRWHSAQWAGAEGGIEKLANSSSNSGTSTAGTQGTLRLEARTLALPANPAERRPINFAYVKLITPPPATTGPTAVPTTAAPAGGGATRPTSPPANAGGAGANGGGLPVTGAGTATAAGVGIALLVAGGVGYVVARRRRTRFVA
jgi:LPXTG-motif cell wall-anchored protein